ncbi:putative RNA-directed DNA polymerase [Senna tora]|uniref:Putative RNA-directed DNA polymerase n=1 Tax=Senna tora TaxID=362788 RepID=A0A834SVA4_9FABA|nr:putative RNA-directed DNA polymerase [Senna tora]
MYGVVNALTEAGPVADADQATKNFWLQAKECRHTILNTLSNEIFDIYSVYKEAKDNLGTFDSQALCRGCWKTEICRRELLQMGDD